MHFVPRLGHCFAIEHALRTSLNLGAPLVIGSLVAWREGFEEPQRELGPFLLRKVERTLDDVFGQHVRIMHDAFEAVLGGSLFVRISEASGCSDGRFWRKRSIMPVRTVGPHRAPVSWVAGPGAVSSGASEVSRERSARVKVASRAGAASSIEQCDADSLTDARGPSLRFGSILAPAPIAISDRELAALEMTQTLVAAGLPVEDAIRLVDRGVTADEATEMMNLALLQPKMSNFGQAALAMRILGEARVVGALSAVRVREIYEAHREMMIVRPDGVLADMISGKPIQYVGDRFPVGESYRVSDGIVYDAHGVVGELAHARDLFGVVANAAEDVVEEALRGLARLAYGLYENPEETIDSAYHAFGGIPKAAVDLIFRTPELYAQFQDLPEHDRIGVMSKLLTSLVLAAIGGAGAGGAVGRGGAAMSGMSVAEVVGGGRVLIGGDLAVAAAQSGPFALHLALMTGSAASRSVGEGGRARDARTEWKLGDRVRRAFGDLDDRVEYRQCDLAAVVALAEKMGSETLAFVRAKLAKRLAEDAGSVSLVELAEVAQAARKVGPEAEQAVGAAFKERIKREVMRVRDLPEGPQQSRAARELRAAADAAEIDIAAMLRRDKAPPLQSLSLEAHKTIRRINRGEGEIAVGSRAVAEEVLSQYPELAETSNWGWPMIKSLLKDGKRLTFHWDDEFGPDGFLVNHGPDNPHRDVPHLQFERQKGKIVRVFFPKDSQ